MSETALDPTTADQAGADGTPLRVTATYIASEAVLLMEKAKQRFRKMGYGKPAL